MTAREVLKLKSVNSAPVTIESLPQISVSRFCDADFPDHGLWMLEKLTRHWPQITQKNMIGWLRGCIPNNEFSFLKSHRAVGLIQIAHSPLTATPRIEEVFVFADDAHDIAALGEAAALYGIFKQWGASRGATEFIIENCTDVPHHLIEIALGGPTAKREITYGQIQRR